MIYAYDALRSSNVWDSRFNLPAVPAHLNPHIYIAYAVRVLESFDVPLLGDNYNRGGAKIIRDTYLKFLRACALADTPGLIATYPEGTTSASHDDAYGASFLNDRFADDCVRYVTENDGVLGGGAQADDESRNIYRFFFVIPVMRAWSRSNRVGLLSQASYCIALIFNLLFTKEGETSGMLLLWLSFPAMRKYKFSAVVIDYWCETWTKRGYTPKSIFTKNYLTECPWFAEFAQESWT